MFHNKVLGPCSSFHSSCIFPLVSFSRPRITLMRICGMQDKFILPLEWYTQWKAWITFANLLYERSLVIFSSLRQCYQARYLCSRQHSAPRTGQDWHEEFTLTMGSSRGRDWNSSLARLALYHWAILLFVFGQANIWWAFTLGMQCSQVTRLFGRAG